MSVANDLTRKIIQFVHDHGGFAWRASTTGIPDFKRGILRSAPKRGVSDILGIYGEGRLIAVEIKIGKDKLSPEQSGFLQNIEHFGGWSFVARDSDSFREWWYSEVDGKSTS